MYANGFFEQQRRHPASLAVVIGLHAAALGAVILFGTTTFIAQKAPRTTTFDVPITLPPPPDPPPPPTRDVQPEQHQSAIDQRPVDAPPVGPQVNANPPTPPQPPVGPVGQQRIVTADATPYVPPPVRRAAEVDPRFRAALQPPYPPDRERAQQEGQVRVRITIGTDGRVTAIEQLSATNDSFWRVTERQARSRWRFRPATVDGRPIVSTMVFTVTFRLPDA